MNTVSGLRVRLGGAENATVNDLSIPGFQRAIDAIHGSDSVFERRVRVVLDEGEKVFVGDVLVFRLQSHPRAPRCYAWEVKGEVTLVLHDSIVTSPRQAVRAAMITDRR
jgi:hypothetical protein